jgi:hypothetical protein
MRRIQKWAVVLSAALVVGGVCRGQAVTRAGENPNAGPARMLAGTVYDASGAPAAGVAISLLGPAASATRGVKSDASGKFTFSWEPLSLDAAMVRGAAFHRLPDNLLVGRDLERNFVATAKIDETATNMDLHLQPGLTLSGAVRDNNGAPVKNAIVRLYMGGDDLGSTVGENPVVLSEQATFTVGALPLNRDYSLNGTAAGFGTAVVLVPATETHVANLQLPVMTLKPADRPLEGVVLGPDGVMAPGARVSVGGPGQPNASTLANANGDFALKVCEGAVLVMGSLQGDMLHGLVFSGSAQTQGGDVKVILRLAAPGHGPGGIAPDVKPPAQTNYPQPIGPSL